jgi:hypothetical protein
MDEQNQLGQNFIVLTLKKGTYCSSLSEKGLFAHETRAIPQVRINVKASPQNMSISIDPPAVILPVDPVVHEKQVTI